MRYSRHDPSRFSKKIEASKQKMLWKKQICAMDSTFIKNSQTFQ